jgi:choline kinase
MHAEAYMDDGFVCAYSDILYTPEIVQHLMESPHPITLVCDTAWRERYTKRTEHPEWDGEKMAAEGDRVAAINRTMESEAARGEYIGVARFTPEGAGVFKEAFNRARDRYGGRPFQASKTFQKAYLIDLFQEMVESGIALYLVETAGGYMEIDTNQDFQIAREEWTA